MIYKECYIGCCLLFRDPMVLSLSSSDPHWRSLVSTSKQCGWAYSKSDFQCGNNLDIFWQCGRAHSPLVVDHGRQCRFISAEVTNNKLKRPKLSLNPSNTRHAVLQKTKVAMGFDLADKRGERVSFWIQPWLLESSAYMKVHSRNLKIWFFFTLCCRQQLPSPVPQSTVHLQFFHWKHSTGCKCQCLVRHLASTCSANSPTKWLI